MTNLKNRLIIGAKYRHYKGKRYEVIGLAKHSETLEDLVLYKALYGKKQIWARPKTMFLDRVKVNNKNVYRFCLIK